MAKSTEKVQSKTALADAEYDRLIKLYTEAGADDIKIKINDRLIRKVAELWALLECMKDLPTVRFDKDNLKIQKETAAGKARVKLFAQYSNAMQKLNKEMLGAINNDDNDELNEYEDNSDGSGNG